MLILLCDDEDMVRLGLKHMLMDLFPEEHSFIEAVNGHELLEKSAFIPDIAFVDVKMPLMDGLSAIELAKEISPSTTWLLLTGYAEFDFARTALRLGVSDYLLKPIGAEQLVSVMENITRRRRDEYFSDNRLFQLEMITLFHYFQMFGELESVGPGSDCDYSICIFYQDGLDRERRISIGKQLDRIIRSEFEDKDCRYAWFHMATSELCLVVQGYREMRRLLSEISPLYVSAIYAESLNSNIELLDAAQAIMAISNLRIVRRILIASLDSLRSDPKPEHLLKIAGIINNICLVYLDGDASSYKNAVAELYAVPPSDYRLCDAETVADYFLSVFNIRFDTSTPRKLAAQLEAHGNEIYRRSFAKSPGDTILQIKTYIKEHYMEEIGVGAVADYMDITPNYLSHMFHRQTGIKFIDYLTNIRIDAAKQLLLKNPELTVQGVAEQVGYISAKHFSKVFVKLVGVYPSDFQKIKGITTD